METLLEGLRILVDLKNLVSITEANPNFPKIARAVDENGSVVILNTCPFTIQRFLNSTN